MNESSVELDCASSNCIDTFWKWKLNTRFAITMDLIIGNLAFSLAKRLCVCVCLCRNEISFSVVVEHKSADVYRSFIKFNYLLSVVGAEVSKCVCMYFAVRWMVNLIVLSSRICLQASHRIKWASFVGFHWKMYSLNYRYCF